MLMKIMYPLVTIYETGRTVCPFRTSLPTHMHTVDGMQKCVAMKYALANWVFFLQVYAKCR